MSAKLLSGKDLAVPPIPPCLAPPCPRLHPHLSLLLTLRTCWIVHVSHAANPHRLLKRGRQDAALESEGPEPMELGVFTGLLITGQGRGGEGPLPELPPLPAALTPCKLLGTPI